jgi:hypothetical protein
LCEFTGIGNLFRSGFSRVGKIDQSQVTQTRCEKRKRRQLTSGEDFGIADGERRMAGVDALDGTPAEVEDGNEYGIGAAGIGQRLQSGAQALFEILDAQTLKVDSKLRADEVQAVVTRAAH